LLLINLVNVGALIEGWELPGAALMNGLRTIVHLAWPSHKSKALVVKGLPGLCSLLMKI